MKVACMQMDMKFGCPEINFLHAEKLICEAVKEQPDVLVLPETWNTGFFPKEDLTSLCCKDGDAVKSRIGILAKKLGINRPFMATLVDVVLEVMGKFYPYLYKKNKFIN